VVVWEGEAPAEPGALVPHPSPQAKGGGRTCAGESVPDRILPPPLLRKDGAPAQVLAIDTPYGS
jgi:hypothetical protein